MEEFWNCKNPSPLIPDSVGVTIYFFKKNKVINSGFNFRNQPSSSFAEMTPFTGSSLKCCPGFNSHYKSTNIILLDIHRKLTFWILSGNFLWQVFSKAGLHHLCDPPVL